MHPMHFPVNSPKRLIGAAAIACAAALIPVAALAATASTARAAEARAPTCATSGVVVWMDTQGSPGAGQDYFTLYFTNLSGHACTLRGSPGVSAVSLGGQQLGRPASGDYSGKTPAVRLASGATATATLNIENVGAFSHSACHQVTAAGLRVYPPNQFASRVIPIPFGACSSRTGPVWMVVQPVQKQKR
jgi:hypothetical protein